MKKSKTITVVIVPDGMADENIPELGKKTPMQVADKPATNYLAANGFCGFVSNVPEGMNPESDTANMSILGFDPIVYSRGRSPLEAVSMGLEMRRNDIAVRCNFVTLTENGEIYADRIILDHSADEITTEEARELISALNEKFGSGEVRFHTGISYRHCLLWENAPGIYDFERPHDILGEKIADYLPKGEIGSKYLRLMEESYGVLNNHEINKKRRERNLNPANSIWLWSAGEKMNLPDFNKKYNLNASVIAAVDLIKGIAMCSGMKTVNVEGATGNFHTDYAAKARAAIGEIENGADFVFIHIEAPDECGHRGELENKIKSVELIDSQVVKPMYEYLEKSGCEYKIVLLPDHPTPIKKRTHTSEPVPFLIYDSKTIRKSDISNFCEDEVRQKSDLYIEQGYKLLDFVFGGKY